MRTIGQLRWLESGGLEGTISTLLIARKIQFVPNEKKKSEDSPDFFVKTGNCDLGFAKRKTSKSENPRPYLDVFLDDPSFDHPIWAKVFGQVGKADLVWSRPERKAD